MILEYSIPARLGIGISILINLGGLIESSSHASQHLMIGTEILALAFSGVGSILYSISKGYSGLIGLLGFLPPYGAPGLLVVCLLKDRKPELKRQ